MVEFLPREDIKLKEKYHMNLKGSFEALTVENFAKDAALKERFKDVGLRKNAKGELVFEGKNGEVKVDDEFKRRNNGDIFTSLHEEMKPEQWNKFNDGLGSAKEGTFLTSEQMLAAETKSTRPEVQEQFNEVAEKKGGAQSSGFKSWITEQFKKLAEKGGEYAILAGIGAVALTALGANRQGCYLYNMGTGALIYKVSSDTSGTKCVCGGRCDNLPYPDAANKSKSCLSMPVKNYADTHMEDCANWCSQMGNDPTPLQDWQQCGQTCSCMSKKGGYVVQSGMQQIGFKVVKGDILTTASWILSSAGLAIEGIVDDALNVVDTLANKVLDFFKQWWVIAIIVVVALIIILVPTLVTQIPKAKAKKEAIAGGGMYLYM